MKMFAKEWGKEIYYDTIDEVINNIKNERIKNIVYSRYLSYVPITKESSFLVKRTKRGFILGVYRLHEVIPPFPLYEATDLNSIKILK